MSDNLKKKTAETLLWNIVDKILSQLIYAIVGVVLARELFPEDFGVIGAVLIFSSFANIFIEGGFLSAIIQKKDANQRDYDTVFFFNLGISIVFYLILFFAAPLIASIFKSPQLVLISRVMFLNLIITSTFLIQNALFVKEMNVKILALSNVIALAVSGGVSLYMVLNGYGVWSLVAQALLISVCKSVTLWCFSKWRPTLCFSVESLKQIFSVGSGILMANFFNTLFLNIYSLIIGAVYNTKSLGYYTQADKWNKVGYTSISQIVGFTFFPALAKIQDDDVRMKRALRKMIRLTSFVSFPIMIGMVVAAKPLFRVLIEEKWDPSILLFQLLGIRSLFSIFTMLLNNFIMAKGKTRLLFNLEVIKDVLSLVALGVTLFFGVLPIVIGMVAVAVVIHIISMVYTGKALSYTWKEQCADMAPYALVSVGIASILWAMGLFIANYYLLLSLQCFVGFGLYYLINKKLNSVILKDIETFVIMKLKGITSHIPFFTK